MECGELRQSVSQQLHHPTMLAPAKTLLSCPQWPVQIQENSPTRTIHTAFSSLKT